jgi:hypothetical protein
MKKNMLKKWFIIWLAALLLSFSAVGMTACTDDGAETESSTDATFFPEVELPWDEF